MNRRPVIVLFLISLGWMACGGPKETAETSDPSEAPAPSKPSQQEQNRLRFDQHFFEAQTQKALGNTGKMKAELLKCLQFMPDNATVHYELARAEYELGNTPAALDHVGKAIDSDNSNSWYHLFSGDLLFESGKFKEAIASYRKTIELDPSQVDVRLDIAAAQIYLNDLAGAVRTYNELEAITGPTEEVSMQKHQINLQLQDFKAAEKDLVDLMNAYPEDPRFAGMLWQFYEQTGQSEKAGELIRKLADADPGNGMVQLFLSEHLAAKGEDAASFEAMKQAFSDPEVPIDNKMGYLLNFYAASENDEVALGRAYELLEVLEVAHPNDAKTYAIYGDFLYRDGRKAEARVKYVKAIDLDASRNLLWLQLVTIDSEIDNMPFLATDSEKAIELFPTIPEFYLYRGMALHRLKQDEEAASVLNMGKELVFDNERLLAEFYSVLGDVQHARKDHQASDEAYDKSLELNPNNPFVLNNYAYYLSLRKENLQKAAAMAKKANEVAPSRASFEDTYAWILFEMGNFNEALTWIEQALKHGGDKNGVILEHHGDILMQLGRTDEAVQQWEKARSTGQASKLIEEKIRQRKYIAGE